jgi:hypothetical protein
MIQRKTFRVDEHCEIALTTERMADGWGVVASVTHRTGDAERVVDLPVPSQRFADEAEAEGFGLTMAREWIAKNAPGAA